MTENNNIEIQSKEELKKYFETGDTPNQHQYAALIDSLRHREDKINANEILGLDNSIKVKFFDLTVGGGILNDYTREGGDSFELKDNEIGLFYTEIQNNDHDMYDGWTLHIFTKGKGIWGNHEGKKPITDSDFLLISKSQYATDISLGFRHPLTEDKYTEHNKLSELLVEILERLPKRTIENVDIVDGYLKLTTDTSPRQVVAQISIKALKKALDEVV